MSSNPDKKPILGGSVELIRTGDAMPLVGLGTWKAPKGEVSQAISEALKAGYRLLDCAADYGNEEEVGEALEAAVSAGVVQRSEVFVTSKLWNTYHREEHVRAALLKTLGDLRLAYLDLFLIHFPISLQFVPFEARYPPEWHHDPVGHPGEVRFDDAAPLHLTWRAMERLVDEGLVRNIGVSNFPAALLMDLLRGCRLQPAVLQVEHHPYLQQPALLRYAAGRGIRVTGYSSFGQVSYLPLGQPKLHPDLLSEVECLQRIAAAHGKSTAQVLLRWATQRGVAVIPKSVSPQRLQQNIALDFELSEQEMQEIAALDRHARFNDPGVYIDYPIYA